MANSYLKIVFSQKSGLNPPPPLNRIVDNVIKMTDKLLFAKISQYYLIKLHVWPHRNIGLRIDIPGSLENYRK